MNLKNLPNLNKPYKTEPIVTINPVHQKTPRTFIISGGDL
jgi:hypothetical protein